MTPVEVLGLHVAANSGSPVLLLQEQDPPHRVLPMFIGAAEAIAIALALDGEAPPRPLTHDLLVNLVDALGSSLRHVEVTELREGAYVAELSLTAPDGQHRVDSRPSDAIALALRVDAPLFVDEAVMDESATQLEEVNEEEIEEQVDQFREFLDDIDPSAFGDPGKGPPQS